jgi:hypothetical protein
MKVFTMMVNSDSRPLSASAEASKARGHSARRRMAASRLDDGRRKRRSAQALDLSCFYVSLTTDMAGLLEVPGLADWWARVQRLKSFQDTQPNLG